MFRANFLWVINKQFLVEGSPARWIWEAHTALPFTQEHTFLALKDVTCPGEAIFLLTAVA